LSSTFSDRLRRHAVERPSHAAVVTCAFTLTYEDLADRVGGGCAYLRSRGILPGMPVGVHLDDETEHLMASLSLMAMGAGPITLASHDTPWLHARLVDRLAVEHVIAAPGAQAPPGTRTIEWPGRATAPAPLPAASGGGHPLLYLRTSGTTGDANIVAFTDAQFAAQAARHLDYVDERLLRLARSSITTQSGTACTAHGRAGRTCFVHATRPTSSTSRSATA
jgi:acyl-CoA synthetase (AMP-forming)/AMP-acid ligase II